MCKNSRLLLHVCMLAGLFFSMSSHSFGMGVHKLIGTLTILLLLAHILSHRRWYRGAFRGKGNFRLILNLLMLLALAGILLSGGMLAKDIGSGLGDTMTAGRLLHNISSYVFCIGIAIHIGFHFKVENRC